MPVAIEHAQIDELNVWRDALKRLGESGAAGVLSAAAQDARHVRAVAEVVVKGNSRNETLVVNNSRDGRVGILEILLVGGHAAVDNGDANSGAIIAVSPSDAGIDRRRYIIQRAAQRAVERNISDIGIAGKVVQFLDLNRIQATVNQAQGGFLQTADQLDLFVVSVRRLLLELNDNIYRRVLVLFLQIFRDLRIRRQLAGGEKAKCVAKKCSHVQISLVFPTVSVKHAGNQSAKHVVSY